MAANVQPVFALKPETKTAIITLATTDKSGATPANMVELLTGAADGTKITWIKFKMSNTTTAGTFLIWITDSAGTNPVLFSEITFAAVTSSNTAATQSGVDYYSDLQLKGGQKIYVGATVVTNPIHVTASIGDFS